MKTFKELREETIELEYSIVMENHPFIELTTEELLDILLDESLDEGHRFNAAYILETRDELSEGIPLLGTAFKAGKGLISKGLSAAKNVFSKKPSVHPMTAKMSKSAAKTTDQPGFFKKAGNVLGGALNLGGIGAAAYMASKDKEGGAGETKPETKPTGSTPTPKPTPKPEVSKPETSSDEEPKTPSVFDDPEFKKDVEKYRSSVPKGTSALEDPAFKKDAASYWASKNKPASTPKSNIHADLANLASQDPDTKAATKTLSTIRGQK